MSAILRALELVWYFNRFIDKNCSRMTLGLKLTSCAIVRAIAINNFRKVKKKRCLYKSAIK